MPNFSIDRYLSRLERAVFEPEILSDALTELAGVAGATSAQLVISQSTTNLIDSYFNTDFDQSILAREAEFWSINPRAIAADAMELGRIYRDHDFISDSARLENKAYVDLFIPGDISHFMGVVLHREKDQFIGLACFRGEDDGAFSDSEVEIFKSAALQSAALFRMAKALKDRKSDYALELVSSAVAAAVIDPSGIIGKHNPAFELLLNRRDFRITASGHIEFGLCNSDELMDYVERVDRDGTLRLPIQSLRTDQFFTARILPLPKIGFASANQSFAILLIEQVEQEPVLDQALSRRVFGFTQSEAEVAAGLFAGLSPQKVADQRGVALSTVKSLLKGVMAKTDTGRQIETIARLHALPRK
jgi:DNA-binding CsgD family transcriptional regulator/PAS domain-containing protein